MAYTQGNPSWIARLDQFEANITDNTRRANSRRRPPTPREFVPSSSRQPNDGLHSTWSAEDGGWDSTNYDDSYHNRNFQPWPYNTPASYHPHTSACRHYHYSSLPRRPQYMPPSSPPRYIPPPQHYQQPRAWTSEPTNQPHFMDALSMLRWVETRLDDIEQRWSRAQSPPRPEPDYPYGMNHAWQSPAWNPGPITSQGEAATKDQVIDMSLSFSCAAERVFAGDDASPSPDISSSLVQTSTSPHMAKHEPATDPIQPIRVSSTEKAERAKWRLCFYCPEKWEQGHVCQTKLLAYFEDDDFDEPNQDDDRANDEENNDTQPEPKGLTEPGVITVPELHGAGAEEPDAEAELHAEPVVEVLKPAVQPCLIAASFAFVSLSHELLQKLPNSSNVGCGIEGQHLEGNFVLVGSMERIRRVIDSLGFRLHVARCVFDPGGNVSPQSAFCSTLPRCAWFIATWYPP